MARHRPRSRTLYLGSDAGLGMIYTLAVVLAARALLYRIFVHHHSAAYVNDQSTMMSAIVRSGGRRCTHLLGCLGQAQMFDERYQPSVPSMVLPISFALAPVAEVEQREPASVHSRLVIGHLSNLCVEKGLETAFQTLDAAHAAGIDAQLVLAGPPATSRDEVLLRALLASHPEVRYLGPVDECNKQRFFDGIDVFLFPTRYRHESFGLVAAEAMQAGVPVIAYRAGCLDRAFVGGAGVALEPEENFVDLAVQQLHRWTARPDELTACGASARDRARSAREEGAAGAAAFVGLLTGDPTNHASDDAGRRG